MFPESNSFPDHIERAEEGIELQPIRQETAHKGVQHPIDERVYNAEESVPSLHKGPEAEANDIASPIRQKHSVSKEPPNPETPGRFQKFVARCILPALNKTPRATRAAEPPITSLVGDLSKAYKGNGVLKPPVIEITSLSGKAKEMMSAGSKESPSYPYHILKFDDTPKKSEHYHILQVPPGTQIDEKLAQVLHEYKRENKNVIIVEISSAEPGKPTDVGDTFGGHCEMLKDLLKDSKIFSKKAKFIPAATYPEVSTNKSNDAVAWARVKLGDPKGSVREVNIASKDGAVLNGIEIRLDTKPGLGALSGPKTPPKQQKWIVYYNKNASNVEKEAMFLADTAKKVGANVICCDYRGVGNSTGFPTSEKDIIADGDAVMQHLLDQGVKPPNIMLYGTSMGGAVATHVAANRVEKGQMVSLCSDRSFSKLSMAIEKICSIFSKILPGLGDLARQIGAYIAKSYGWELDSGSKLPTLLDNHTKVIVMHHPGDFIVEAEAAAQRALPHDHDHHATVIELGETEATWKKVVEDATRQGGDIAEVAYMMGYAHNRRLYANEEELFIKAARDALRIPTPQTLPAA